ncbi:hypothetical protein U0038_01885 [Sphingobacterium spiritivorum]|uniref:Uncharacterized protein n=1 Tax=Sphingobacterium spiritivorum ATCC 33861 TaxID=525373 RepID=D7VHU1_SPHSI|nr:hypothetical protein [Sphingobacterium spiritivorum]EFK59643.1 hypothetical protein HMPREF0766_10560 [Sphingobacterium spiritivorum ATCC 33861]QQT37700.1 hypothetical protein I6J01_09955 [Sphingobacterium spiritivorum]WQD34503.1 hypothetical protein U0038_01885 [Sphingobacterium spiritivorum]SUI97485.1 Uncharacterised protein [Sphingobacterium spiritivorum]
MISQRGIVFLILIFLPKIHSYSQQFLVNDINKYQINSQQFISKGHDAINIELLSIPFGGESLPLSISYQNEPPKYGQLPGLLGHSWSFSFQYHLTRSERSFQYLPIESYYNSAHELYDDTNGQSYDFFRFSTPYGSGSFMYDPYNTNGPQSHFLSNFDSFAFSEITPEFSKITDNRGWQYIYGDTLVLDSQVPVEKLEKGMRLNASLLKQIIAPNHDTLTITYSRGKIRSPHKRIEISIHEPLDIAPQVNGSEYAITRIDTPGMGEKYIYYPSYAQLSNGNNIEFSYSFSDSCILLNSISFLGKQVDLTYYQDRYATLLNSVNLNGEIYTMSYLTEGSDGNGSFSFKNKNLFVDVYGDYIYRSCDPPLPSPCPDNILSLLPTGPFFTYVDKFSDSERISKPYFEVGNFTFAESFKTALQPTFYMLSSIQNPMGGKTEYKYEVSPVNDDNTFLNYGAGYRLSQRLSKDTNGDTVLIDKYSYGQARQFPFEVGSDPLLRQNSLMRAYIQEGAVLHQSYRYSTTQMWQLEPHHYSLARNFRISNVPVYANEEEEYMEDKGVFHEHVTIESSDPKGIIGKKVYSFNVPGTIKRSNSQFINYSYNVLGEMENRVSYATWLGMLTLGNEPRLRSEMSFTYQNNQFLPIAKKEYQYDSFVSIALNAFNWGNIYDRAGAFELSETQLISDCNIMDAYGIEGGGTVFQFMKNILRSVKSTSFGGQN